MSLVELLADMLRYECRLEMGYSIGYFCIRVVDRDLNGCGTERIKYFNATDYTDARLIEIAIEQWEYAKNYWDLKPVD